MRHFTIFFLGLVLSAAVTAPTGHAAEPHPHVREAFVLGGGAGWGNAGADLNTVEAVDRENGVAGDVMVGWAVRNNVIAGFEFDLWSQFFRDTRWVFNLSSVTLTVYPVDGLFFAAGLGVGTSRVEYSGSGGSTVRQDRAGLGYSVAGGYEFRILEDIALAPKVKWAYLDINGDVTNWVDYLTVTLQLTWYMPKH